jgi:hypothetical protein
MMKAIAWNIARRVDAWRWLLECDADLAILQEAAEPPPDIAGRLEIDPWPWHTAGADIHRPWRTAIVKLSDRVGVQWVEAKPLAEAAPREFAVSRLGTLSVAAVTFMSEPPILVASMYAPWERPLAQTGSQWIYADASAHRLISDLSGLVGQQAGHRILAAGDLNILQGYGEHGSAYWAGRYASAFARMAAIGLPFVGPQAPAGRTAEPWPKELPLGSRNVPTYYSSRQTPASATRQLDFVFASVGLADTLRVHALNDAESWGPSDHCRVEITIPTLGEDG